MEPFDLRLGELLLRPWCPGDVAAVWAAVQDPDIQLWNDAGCGTVDGVRDMLARRRDWSPGDHASWAVVRADDGELLGSVSLHSIQAERGDAEIGYWTVPAARGQGVAGRVVDAVCTWAFSSLGLARVQLLHAVENRASARVAAKAGFTLEGRLRSSYRYGDGRRHDELLWSRLAGDPPPDPPPVSNRTSPAPAR